MVIIEQWREFGIHIGMIVVEPRFLLGSEHVYIDWGKVDGTKGERPQM